MPIVARRRLKNVDSPMQTRDLLKTRELTYATSFIVSNHFMNHSVIRELSHRCVISLNNNQEWDSMIAKLWHSWEPMPLGVVTLIAADIGVLGRLRRIHFPMSISAYLSKSAGLRSCLTMESLGKDPTNTRIALASS